ncbi:hypothetical protein F5B22DRAFT_644038 [Xylaria bambusicola]|uniref:uncharacterized protein n=1 Tax=Xylaria bambusicola TaxID=326684 RepID=UPI002008199F|nr:uncharacterized protein F5B22DRAFT_644038 [Xylaria bambusicola]KAI0521313.1 hypothetical protein F5B22DRAFT_644038 [Xylaria bambusicola]
MYRARRRSNNEPLQKLPCFWSHPPPALENQPEQEPRQQPRPFIPRTIEGLSTQSTDRSTTQKYRSNYFKDLGEVPESGGVYMIREIDTKRTITLRQGQVTMTRGTSPQGGWQWICEERQNGYIGFRDIVSGKYLGRGSGGEFHAEAKEMGDKESFVLRPRNAGGHNLMVKRWRGLKAVAMGDCENAEPKLVEASSRTSPARLEFIRVGRDTVL